MKKRPRPSDISLFDSLEPRMLLSSYVYQDFAEVIGPQSPSILASGYRGPAVFLGDVNNDGVSDLLVGNSGFTNDNGNFIDNRGAGVFSGADGSLIRNHAIAEFRAGWNVAALGDTDGDGVPDYAIGKGIGATGTNADTAYVFSGATGNQLLALSNDANGAGGATVAGIGDINNDGNNDILVGHIGQNVARVYSGVNGAVLHTFVGDGNGGISRTGIGVAGGVDFNNDTVPDFLIAAHSGNHTGFEGDNFEVVITLYSGANGSVINTLNSFQGIPSNAHFIPAIAFDLSGDFNDDGVNDVVQAGGPFVRILDTTDGSTILSINPTLDRSARSVAVIGDVNADGTPDLAVGIPTRTSTEVAGQAGAVLVYSGSNGARLSILSDDRFTSPNARVGSYIAYGGDVNGDGLGDLIAVADQNVQGTVSGAGRFHVFSGESLVTPIPHGFSQDAAGNPVTWGMIGNQAYIVRNGTFTLGSSLNGFNAGDRIISFHHTTDGGVYILGASDNDGNNPFVWRPGNTDFNNGTRTNISGFTEVNSPGGTFSTLYGKDINASGMVAVHRFRDNHGPTAWLFNPNDNTLTYIFDGAPIAINDSNAVTALTGDAAAGLFWTQDDGLTTIPGFIPLGINNSGVVMGQSQQQGDTALRPYLWQNGNFTAVPLIDGGQTFVGTDINDDGVVVGTYRPDGSLTISMFIYDPTAGTTSDLPTLVDVDAATSFTGASNFQIFGLNDAGQILGRNPSATTSFLLTPYTENGPYIVDESAIISSAAVPGGGLVVTTVNPAGDVIAFRRTAADAPWIRYDVTHLGGLDRITGDVVTWFDPQENRVFIAAGSTGGLLLVAFPQGNDAGDLVVRNLTTEISGSEAVIQSLIILQPQSGLTLVGGLTAAGDVAIYGQTDQTNGNGQTIWAYNNLFNTVVRANNLPVPEFDIEARGRLIAYETPWDGLNIVGSGVGGQPISLWTAPGLDNWALTNLSEASGEPGAQSGFTHLTAYITSWGGINIASGSNLNVVWWVPGFEGDWAFTSLRDSADGPELQADTLTAYFAPWGGLNVAGLDDQDRLWIYWWVPTEDQWFVTPIFEAVGDTWSPEGNLSSLATSNDTLNVFARTSSGDLVHYFWQPGSNWTLSNLSLQAVDPA